ncbi:MAG: glycosyltransferase family 4 protein [Anaerolineae bacterium]|nr:glycosyltransferase family 4 protein [Anaerolineae bacterium]
MKILLVSSFFPPTHTAGTEKRTLGYALKLREPGHEVQVVCAGKFDQGNHYWNGYVDETFRQIPVRRVHLNWGLASDPNRFLYCNPIVEKYLGQWLEQWQPDVVHITSCYTLSASVIQAAQARKLPVVLTLTDYWFICPRLNLLRGDGSLCNGRATGWECLRCMLWDTKAYCGLNSIMSEATTAAILTWISKHPGISRKRGLRGMALDMEHRKSYLATMIESVNCIIAPSESLYNVFKAVGISKPIKVIRSGHDLTWLETLPPPKISERIRIGYIGQIIPIKGVHLLLSAFISNSWGDRAQLSIFGDYEQSAEYMQKLQALAEGKKENVMFHGAFPHEHLGDILSQIDVLVVPSQWHENNPRVIQEAFASKTPVIASKVGGISEFVQHEVNGLLFERGDADDLAHQLRRVMTEPGLLEHLQARIPRVKRIEEEVEELIEIYERLINRIDT